MMDVDLSMWVSPYRAGDDTHILGILFEPVVHVLTHSKQVVEAGSLSRWPITLGNLERGWHREQEKEKARETDKQVGKRAEEREKAYEEEKENQRKTERRTKGGKKDKSRAEEKWEVEACPEADILIADSKDSRG